MDRKRCIQFLLSLGSVAISLVLDMYAPYIKTVVCLSLPAPLDDNRPMNQTTGEQELIK